MSKNKRTHNNYDPREMQRLLNQLQQLVYATYSASLKTPSIKQVIANGSVSVCFFLNQNQAANRAIDSELRKMAMNMDAAMKQEFLRAWQSGVDDAFGKIDHGLPGALETEMQKLATDIHQQRALSVYNQKHGDSNISDRIWNLCETSKKEIEVIIQNGIKEGKSADDIQRSLKGYLNDPDKLFRRVKDKETGEWEWSEAAKQYKPGRGVYKSAVANATRLARTEINAAYRRAEWESYQNNPLVVGYEIRVAEVRTRLEHRKDLDLTDICDELAGVYPKTFLWTGWHPHCLCYMVPILISEEELAERRKMRADGTLDKWKPKNAVTELPKQFQDWIAKNTDRINNAKSLPYFIQDNQNFVTPYLMSSGPIALNGLSLEYYDKNSKYKIESTDKGVVRISDKHGKNEKSENTETAKYFAEKYGHEIDLLSRFDDKKSPDVYNRTLGIFQEYKTINVSKQDAIDREIRVAKNQASHIVLLVQPDISNTALKKGMQNRVKRTESIETITIIRGGNDKIYTREQIIQDDFTL